LTSSMKKFLSKKKIKIKKIIKTSLIDWEGMIVTTLYAGGCNFRCPFCYNTDLVINSEGLPTISEEKIFVFLVERKPFIDGICLSGGEPTLYDDLPEFLARIRDFHLKIKLDTNGSHPEKLAVLLEQHLIDYVAMDIKNSLRPNEYGKTIGIQNEHIIAKIKRSIHLIMNAGIDYEFRTTIVPGFHDDEMIKEIAEVIKGAQRYILQKFIQSEKMLDPCLKDINPYSEEKMKALKKKIEPYVQKCQVR